MLATLLLSNALVAWHSGAHYFEDQSTHTYSQSQLQNQAQIPANAPQVHTELCEIGVLAHGLAAAVAAPFTLPTLAAPSFWLLLDKPAQVFSRLISFHDARAPPLFSR